MNGYAEKILLTPFGYQLGFMISMQFIGSAHNWNSGGVTIWRSKLSMLIGYVTFWAGMTLELQVL